MCEAYLGMEEHADFNQVDSVIQQAIPSVFDKAWPIFDENYRLPLESKILRWFWFREIGTETSGEFKLLLSNKLMRIMPYYNQLYNSELIKFDPMSNINYEHKSKRNATRQEDLSENRTGVTKRTANVDGSLDSMTDISNTTDVNQTNNATGNVVSSDTPQGLVQDVLDKKYASEVSQTVNNDTLTGKTSDSGSQSRNDTTTTNSKEDENSTNDRNQNVVAKDLDEFIETINGKQGGESYAKLLTELRESFLNIDAMILDELEELFFSVMDGGCYG